MDRNEIIDVFFNDVLPKISKGDFRVDGAVYNVRFNTVIYKYGKPVLISDSYNPNIPTMTIKNMEMFCNNLVDFINKVMNTKTLWTTPYIDVSSKKEELRYFLGFMWSNMNANDFLDPAYYIKRYLSFLNDKTFDNFQRKSAYIPKLDNSCLEITNEEQKSCYETPYSFRISIINENNDRYFLPDVKYAIEDFFGEKRAYIYAVQYDPRMKEHNIINKKFSSKINRLLYKVNQDIPQNILDKKNNDTESSILDVTPSALVSLTVALSLFKEKGISKVFIPGYLPLRWDAKSEMYRKKLAYYQKNGYSEEMLKQMEDEFWEEQLRIARNVTDKMMRNFMRLEYHFDGLKIFAYPLEGDDFMHLYMDENLNPYNDEHLLASISKSVSYIKKTNYKNK